MNSGMMITNIVIVCGLFAIASCSTQEEKLAKPAAPASSGGENDVLERLRRRAAAERGENP